MRGISTLNITKKILKKRTIYLKQEALKKAKLEHNKYLEHLINAVDADNYSIADVDMLVDITAGCVGKWLNIKELNNTIKC